MEIITASGQPFQLDFSNSQLKEHFDNPSGYAKVIVDQINNSDLYDFLKDKQDLTIIDIGANIGLFTIFCSTIANKIISVEPTPAHCELLRFNTSTLSNVQVVEKAISDKPGDCLFYINDSNSTMNSFEYKTNKSIVVEATTLTDLVKDLDSVDMIKVDIEGGELHALTKQQIENVADKVKSWFIEVHQTNSGSFDQNRMILESRFKDCNYTIQRIGVDGLYVYR